MVVFEFVSQRPLLARDAAWLVYKTMEEDATIIFEAEGRTTETEYYKDLRLISLLSLGIREGSYVCVKVTGDREEFVSCCLKNKLRKLKLKG